MGATRRGTEVDHRYRSGSPVPRHRSTEPVGRPLAFDGPRGGSAAVVPQVPPADSLYVRFCKPVIDHVAAAVILLLALPLILVVAATVLLTLGRPVLYRQRRVGQGGEVFRVWKFRTMLPDRRVSEHPVDVDRRVCHKREDDPRHTRVGTVLRRWRLDELPQLVNILSGSMSLVGPRPELVEVVSRYQPWQHRRHAVKPGLTGLWQVSTPTFSGLMHENTHVDLDYIDRIGLRTDVRILLRTVRCVLARSGR
jgi:lipopolysaccharide/colanic/teichoic acid biosynthesis glycosyltransferase